MQEFSAAVVKAFKSFYKYFRCLTASPGRAVGSWSWRGTSMVRGLISERLVNLIRCKKKIPAGKSPGGD